MVTLPYKTSPRLIQKAMDEGWIKQLALYHLLKFHFNNSCIYDYRSRMNKLAQMFDICPKTLYTYLKVLRSKNLIYDHSNNLILTSIRKFETGRKCTILINLNHSINDIACLLYGKIIEQEATKRSFVELIKRGGRTDKQKSKLCEKSSHPSLCCLSNRLVAKVLKVSHFKSFMILKKLVRLGVIRIHKQHPNFISGNFTALQFIEDFPGHQFNIGTRLYSLDGSKIEFLQFPVEIKPLTLSDYKRLKKRHL